MPFGSPLLFWVMFPDKTLEVKKAVTKTTLIIFQRSPTNPHERKHENVLSTHRPEAIFLWKILKATAIHESLAILIPTYPHTLQSTFYQPDTHLGCWCSAFWDMGPSLLWGPPYKPPGTPMILPALLYLTVLYILDAYQVLPPGTGEGWYWLNNLIP